MRSILTFCLVLLVSAQSASGFLPQLQKGAAGASKSALADEAMAVFDKKFPFGREPLKQSPFLNSLLSIGMPATDIDGTKYKVYKAGESRGKRLSDISEKQARATFAEMAKLYGEENALEMTKAQPICLTFDRKQFAPSLKEYTNIFGEEEAIAMVSRNPGLLAIRPAEAAKASDQTMQASYLIASTRPLGSVLLPTLLFLLLVPALESVSGIPIRTTFLSTFTGASPDEVASVLTKVATPIWKQF